MLKARAGFGFELTMRALVFSLLALLVTWPALEAELDASLERPYHKEFFGLRPEVLLMVYIEEPLWDRFIERRSGLSLPKSADGP